MASNKYGIKNFRKQFKNDDACLGYVFSTLHTFECSCGGTYRKIKGRKQYQCSKCRFQIAPTAGTIFHKSDTPLTLWFEAIFRFSNAKSGYSAKQLERDLGVTYKCAWRMLRLIREALNNQGDKLSGDVEVDAGYIGGEAKVQRRMKNKSTAIAAIKRGGETRVAVMPNATAEAHMAFITLNVKPEGTRLLTDAAAGYKSSAKGYHREAINHKKEYVRGDVHINNVENFWSHVKRSIRGVHKHVSPKHLQSYLDGFAFHANNRGNDTLRFFALLNGVLQPSR